MVQQCREKPSGCYLLHNQETTTAAGQKASSNRGRNQTRETFHQAAEMNYQQLYSQLLVQQSIPPFWLKQTALFELYMCLIDV